MSLSQPYSQISVVLTTEPPYGFNSLISRINKPDMYMLSQPPCLISPGKNIICPIVASLDLPLQYLSHQHVINHPNPAGTSQELKIFYKP